MKTIRKAIVLFLSFIVISVSLGNVLSQPVNAATEIQAKQWMDDLIPQKKVVTNGGSECVAVFNEYLGAVFGINWRNTDYRSVAVAKDIYDKQPPAGFSKISGNKDFRVGDIIVINGVASTDSGHVAIVYSVSGSTVTMFHQHSKDDGKNYIYYAHTSVMDSNTKSRVKGVIRPPFESTERGSMMTKGYDRVLPDGDYIIACAGSSDKETYAYLDIVGQDCPAANNTNVHVFNAKSINDCDTWTIKYENGFYTIRQKGYNMYLDLTNGDTANGTNVQVYQGTGDNPQKWAISGNMNTGYRIEAKCSGFSLDLENGSMSDYTNARAWVDNDTDAQSWLFIPYKPSQPVAEGRYVFLSSLGTGLEMDVSGDSDTVADGTNVQLWSDKATSRTNAFNLKKLSNGYYKIIHAVSGKALDAASGSSKIYSNITVKTAKDTKSQEWALIPNAGGYVFVSRSSGMALDVDSAKTANGTNIRLHPFNFTKAQVWKPVKSEYKVQYDANYPQSSKVSGVPSSQIKYYKTDLKLSASIPTLSGYKFLGWQDSSNSNSTIYQPGSTYNLDKDITLAAVWTEDKVADPTSAPNPTSAPGPTDVPSDEPDNKVVDLDLYKISDAVMVCGDVLELNLKTDDKKTPVVWESTEESIASVDSDGKVTAKMAGITVIRVNQGDNWSQCCIQVLYKDVTDSTDFWYLPTYYLTNIGVVKGYNKQTEFRPANECTRAQMVTFIWRLMGSPKPKTDTCKFSDVKKSDYFYKACIWGNENHIVEGYKDGTFGPQIVCARRHAVTFLWRLAGQPEPVSKSNKFTDVKTSDYFYKATLWASEMKILAGYEDNTFRPNGDCLRRQMVTFLQKYDRYVASENK